MLFIGEERDEEIEKVISLILWHHLPQNIKAIVLNKMAVVEGSDIIIVVNDVLAFVKNNRPEEVRNITNIISVK